MTGLEQRLRALGAEIVFPATPVLAGAGTAGVQARRRPRRLLLAGLALAIAVLCFGAVLAASPGARSGLRNLFGIGDVRVVRENEPAGAAEQLVAFGRPVTLAEARRGVTFEILLPDSIAGRGPSRIYLDPTVGEGLVSVVWCCSPRVVLTEVVGNGVDLLYKSVGQATTIEEVSVGGKPGLWVDGSDHVLRIVDSRGVFQERAVAVRGGVLAWVDQGVTFRLEGELTRAEALALALRLH